ncbi:flagellar motor switch protein FliN [Legionella geestiana]|uniref:Flagellar motor switch protein FliN n=1 Tax=Legionella geestiana TaxID=45065 RepID=A0A0W0TXQ9_9GAMM|nr:FliM/FliN family flagellar motor switch protein [Legionella geestiana]KTD00123.1 flagellar motor switch protein FliN [Legionella geestiana]QBS11831.1 hypothetical protein E4T54_03195 [Legionella geestiana]QDQ40554.1 FliM/FliN family flagellar motor switch protein [Legionella geestiana]STX53474.1 flagellar motor switch protein FliN [Legionella geestiana]
MTDATEDNGSAIEHALGDRLFEGGNVGILDDITMDLTVEIGRAKIKISDLLNLKKGAIIELNQGSDEPLNIYANDKPIARGHIISAGGKYCVRIV